MTRRLLTRTLVTAAAFSVLSSMTLEAGQPTAARITALAALTVPLVVVVTGTTRSAARAGFRLIRRAWLLIRRTARTP